MISISMESYLETVSPHLAAAIVDGEAGSRVRAVATQLPPCPVAGLELRLRDDQRAVDFFVRHPYARRQLAYSLAGHPVWQAVGRLCDDVASLSGRLHEQVVRIFVESDLGFPRPKRLPEGTRDSQGWRA